MKVTGAGTDRRGRGHMSGPDAPEPDQPGPDIPEPDFRPPEKGGPDLPDSEIPETPETGTPGTEDLGLDITLEPDIDRAIDRLDEREGEELYTNELLPESESVEWEPPDEPSPLSRGESRPEGDLDELALSATEGVAEGGLDEGLEEEEEEEEELAEEEESGGEELGGEELESGSDEEAGET
jgi:hypothetical protein